LVYPGEEVVLVSLDLITSIQPLLALDMKGVQGVRPPLFLMAGTLLALVEADVEHRNVVFADHWLRKRIASILEEVNELARTLKDRGALPSDRTEGWGQDWTRFNQAFLSPEPLPPA
jgi:hypothetical protein